MVFTKIEHKTSATLGQSYVADISKVSRLNYKISFVKLALKKCPPNELPDAPGTFGSGGQSS